MNMNITLGCQMEYPIYFCEMKRFFMNRGSPHSMGLFSENMDIESKIFFITEY